MADSSEPTIHSSRISNNLQNLVESILLSPNEEELLLDSTSSTDSILKQLQENHTQDIQTSSDASFGIETRERNTLASPIQYEWIYSKTATNEQHPIAIRSLIAPPHHHQEQGDDESQPLVLDYDSTVVIMKEAQARWRHDNENDDNNLKKKSRFTYQRPGNYEAHTSDLGPRVMSIVNDMLRHKVYPLLREAFLDDHDGRDGQLFVYDSLVIRYNATEAHQLAASTSCPPSSSQHQPKPQGAGQPLHKDFGLVSVNIMLNDQEDFEGGGTFFENQLRGLDTTSTMIRPLKPLGRGSCLAHWSSERHAGACCSSGVRDIMVFFITTTNDPLFSARLKQTRDVCGGSQREDPFQSIRCRLLRHYLAVQTNPKDGEASQYLGTSLMGYADLIMEDETKDQPNAKEILLEAERLLEHAALLTPCDARVYNNLALIRQRMFRRYQTGTNASIEMVFREGLRLLEASEKAGCDVARDMDQLELNLGLHLANLDRFHEAVSVLARMAGQNTRHGDDDPMTSTQMEMSRIVNDAFRLHSFCQTEARKKPA
jgi:hypothetical protein